MFFWNSLAFSMIQQMLAIYYSSTFAFIFDHAAQLVGFHYNSSPTRDRTHPHSVEAQSLNHWTDREALHFCL